MVFGGGGFIGNHLVSNLKKDSYHVVAVDLKLPEFSTSAADEFIVADLRNYNSVSKILTVSDSNRPFDEIYQLAADMGGAGFVFTGDNDADILHNSATINLNVLDNLQKNYTASNSPVIFYSSSACMYPDYNQLDPKNPKCEESSAYPANPDSEYGWEKLFSERLYLAYSRNYGLKTKIARYHNIYGPMGTWRGGREKAPAALCRKIITANQNGEIEIWGTGEQTRSFLYIDDCIKATRRLVQSETFHGPVNIGSEELISINKLAEMIAKIADKKIAIRHVPGPLGVMGRNSDNNLIEKELDWTYEYDLAKGLRITYEWINEQILIETKNGDGRRNT
jgi:GDP-D-mannose 3',5'-epimerase